MKRKFADATQKSAIKIKPVVHTASKTLNLGQGAYIDFYKNAYTPQVAAPIYKDLHQNIEWTQKEVTVFSRRVMQPRLISYQGDMQYTYSKQTLEPAAFHPTVTKIKEFIEQQIGHTFNSVLMNYYRNGADSMGWHSDNEPLYGPAPVIAAVSFGATRDFILRKNDDHNVKHTFPLGCGDVLVMRGNTQQYWMHYIPKRAGVPGGRISLTFRQILDPEELNSKK